MSCFQLPAHPKWRMRPLNPLRVQTQGGDDIRADCGSFSMLRRTDAAVERRIELLCSRRILRRTFRYND